MAEDQAEFDEHLLFSEFDAVDHRPTSFSSLQRETVDISPSMDVKSLQNENNRLKQLIRKLLVPVSCKHVNTKEKPSFHAVFFNNKVSTDSRNKLEFFLQSVATLNGESVNEPEKNESLSLPCLQPSLFDVNDFLIQSESSTCTDNSKEDPRNYFVMNYAQYFDFYCIDASGIPVVEYTSSSNEGWEIPLYEQVFFTALPCELESSFKVKVKRKKACFNCGSVAHNLSDCPEPQNLARIDSMRQKFIKKFSSPFSKDLKRYHNDEKRFGSFKPGIISTNLREALGLKSNEVPHYIYRMREIGYPPGYIPSLNNLTLLLYNGEGDVEDYVMEDLDEDCSENNKQNAFFEYPGFNCPLPEGVRDRSDELGFPPISPHQSIDNMNRWHNHRISSTSTQKCTKGKKRQWSETVDSAVDMDLDEEEQTSHDVHVNSDAVKRRKTNELGSAIDDGGYSPTRPNMQYGRIEEQLLDKIHLSSSKKSQIPLNKADQGNLTEGISETNTSTAFCTERINAPANLEDGEIVSDEEGVANIQEQQENLTEKETKVKQGWWLDVPLTSTRPSSKTLNPPPLPAVKLPMDLLTRFYTTSTVLQKVSFEDRIMWLDPIYGNIQVSSGRYDRLKEILQRGNIVKKRHKK